jgi:hypothetical protein
VPAGRTPPPQAHRLVVPRRHPGPGRGPRCRCPAQRLARGRRPAADDACCRPDRGADRRPDQDHVGLLGQDHPVWGRCLTRDRPRTRTPHRVIFSLSSFPPVGREHVTTCEDGVEVPLQTKPGRSVSKQDTTTASALPLDDNLATARQCVLGWWFVLRTNVLAADLYASLVRHSSVTTIYTITTTPNSSCGE